MKKSNLLSFFLLTIALSLFLGSCNMLDSVRGNGNVVKETRNIDSFTGVKASAGINVYLFQGDEEKVVVEADENLMDCVVTKVEGNVLRCYLNCNVVSSSKLNVYVNFKSINKIDASSGSDVYGETIIKTDFLDLGSSSGADLKVEVEAGNVECNVSSGADALIKGKADHFDGGASSGGNINAKDLTVKTCDASASSAGNISITVTENIDADASSGGNINYYGNPKSESTNESSGGDVSRR